MLSRIDIYADHLEPGIRTPFPQLLKTGTDAHDHVGLRPEPVARGAAKRERVLVGKNAAAHLTAQYG